LQVLDGGTYDFGAITCFFASLCHLRNLQLDSRKTDLHRAGQAWHQDRQDYGSNPKNRQAASKHILSPDHCGQGYSEEEQPKEASSSGTSRAAFSPCIFASVQIVCREPSGV
jgi:hypothetical protein